MAFSRHDGGGLKENIPLFVLIINIEALKAKNANVTVAMLFMLTFAHKKGRYGLSSECVYIQIVENESTKSLVVYSILRFNGSYQAIHG